MKAFLIITLCLLLIAGCSLSKEQVQQFGEVVEISTKAAAELGMDVTIHLRSKPVRIGFEELFLMEGGLEIDVTFKAKPYQIPTTRTSL